MLLSSALLLVHNQTITEFIVVIVNFYEVNAKIKFNKITHHLFISCPAIRCQPLFSIMNGQIQYNKDSTSDFMFETVATYECAIGFTLTGGDSIRTCIGDGRGIVGSWSGIAPTCHGKKNEV